MRKEYLNYDDWKEREKKPLSFKNIFRYIAFFFVLFCIRGLTIIIEEEINSPDVSYLYAILAASVVVLIVILASIFNPNISKEAYVEYINDMEELYKSEQIEINKQKAIEEKFKRYSK